MPDDLFRYALQFPLFLLPQLSTAMKKLLLLSCLLCSMAVVSAHEKPLWMRHGVISPDGTEIAFTYKGDIYTVPVAGGRAKQITSNPAFDGTPIWNADGSEIAFSSDREGSMDVYVVSREGGIPRRLTTHSGQEYPLLFTMDGNLLFQQTSCHQLKRLSFLQVLSGKYIKYP